MQGVTERFPGDMAPSYPFVAVMSPSRSSLA